MGLLAQQAKKNSNWLMVNVGDSTVVKFIDFKVIPSTLDPTKETIQYRLLENGQEKYWTNGSGKVMLVFDTLVKGKSWVKISRSPWIDKAGVTVAGKSTWVVEKTEEPKVKDGVPMNSTDEKSWDEQ